MLKLFVSAHTYILQYTDDLMQPDKVFIIYLHDYTLLSKIEHSYWGSLCISLQISRFFLYRTPRGTRSFYSEDKNYMSHAYLRKKNKIQ